MNNTDYWNEIEALVSDYIRDVKAEFHARWEKWPLDLSNREMYEVIGALVARQVTLAAQLAASPGIWNGHVAPLILRSMTDNYINLAWIFVDPLDRSRKFMLFGLGQEKLQLEHQKARLAKEGKDADKDDSIKKWEDWLNTQRYTFLTEVNIGSWSGIDTRKMAEEANCIDIYNYAYAPFSAATHNMWNHIAKYNLAPCPNVLHRFHKIPVILSLTPDLDYVYRAARYVKNVFELFDDRAGISHDIPSAYEAFVQAFNMLEKKLEAESDTQATNLE
jgi:hypothetical protein